MREPSGKREHLQERPVLYSEVRVFDHDRQCRKWYHQETLETSSVYGTPADPEWPWEEDSRRKIHWVLNTWKAFLLHIYMSLTISNQRFHWRETSQTIIFVFSNYNVPSCLRLYHTLDNEAKKWNHVLNWCTRFSKMYLTTKSALSIIYLFFLKIDCIWLLYMFCQSMNIVVFCRI